MVSHDSPQNLASSMVQQFFISGFVTSQNQFENQNFNGYGSDLRDGNTFPQSLGLMPSTHSHGERMSRSIDLVQAPSMEQDSEVSHTRHLMDLLGAANATNHQPQGLSLSLGPHMLASQVQYRQRSTNSDFVSPSYLFPEEYARKDCNPGFEQVNNHYSYTCNAFASSSTVQSRSSSTSYGTESFSVAIKKSRYLKPAQVLLEETVSVNAKAAGINNEKLVGNLFSSRRRGALGLCSELKAELCCNGFIPADRHELQVKFTKLVALLDEIEGRYEKYYHQMEQVISSFEEIAGFGTAQSYTAQALQAMSRHFCNLRDAILSQIKATRRTLSQDLPKISKGLSRLSLFDKETGHNRMSLQQLGMIQSQRQAWRPIRGLPETSVTILRSWLFEHFLHPYPNDSEKLMLASQTSLTKNQVKYCNILFKQHLHVSSFYEPAWFWRTQVSNWFINARVRLWKPMIEEMYKEEFADSAEESNPFLDSSSMARDDVADDSED